MIHISAGWSARLYDLTSTHDQNCVSKTDRFFLIVRYDNNSVCGANRGYNFLQLNAKLLA